MALNAAPEGPEIPPALPSHARGAARAGIPLEQILRAYTSGYSAFVKYASGEGEPDPSLSASTQMLGSLASQFDRTINAVVSEYTDATPPLNGMAPPFKTRLVQKLLKGEHVDSSVLHYDFGGRHIALIMERDDEAVDLLRTIARRSNVRVLVADFGDDTVTAWFGSGVRGRLEELLFDAEAVFRDMTIAAGEPCAEYAGWQLTYRQAESIWPYVRRSVNGIHRYAENGLIAAIAFNPLLARSMRGLYVEPLNTGSDGSSHLVETVRAYLSCGRNTSSAAAYLGLSRQTVSSRLRAAEEKLGRPLDQCGSEVEIALRLDQLPDGQELRSPIC
jgi:hypothetical protein